VLLMAMPQPQSRHQMPYIAAAGFQQKDMVITVEPCTCITQLGLDDIGQHGTIDGAHRHTLPGHSGKWERLRHRHTPELTVAHRWQEFLPPDIDGIGELRGITIIKRQQRWCRQVEERSLPMSRLLGKSLCHGGAHSYNIGEIGEVDVSKPAYRRDQTMPQPHAQSDTATTNARSGAPQSAMLACAARGFGRAG
jgi:hypothetical protein